MIHFRQFWHTAFLAAVEVTEDRTALTAAISFSSEAEFFAELSSVGSGVALPPETEWAGDALARAANFATGSILVLSIIGENECADGILRPRQRAIVPLCPKADNDEQQVDATLKFRLSLD
jgi:hypothetical protein